MGKFPKQNQANLERELDENLLELLVDVVDQKLLKAIVFKHLQSSSECENQLLCM